MSLFGKKSIKSRFCEYCGKSFEVRSSWQSQKFCSHACYAESIRRIHVTKEELEHWYFDLGMTSIEIAERLGCNDRHVRDIMSQHEIRLRDKADAAIDYPCHPFSGSPTEKAYMIGFRLGDLNVRKDLGTSKRIQVRSSSTVPAQIELICNLFAPYGHVNLRTGSMGETQVECRLDNSFDFLLPKEDRVPIWVQKNDSCFWAFTAGYTDAEGYIGVRQSGTHWDIQIQIASCDIGILTNICQGLEKRGLACSLYEKSKTSTGRAFYCLSIARKSSLGAFFVGMSSYLRHADKRARMEKALAILRA